MKNSNYEKLVSILHDLRAIPKIIKLKKQYFEKQLCNPSLDPFRAFNKYIQLKNEIDYLEWKIKTFKDIMRKQSKRDVELLKLVMQEKNIFTIESKLQIGRRQIFRDIAYYSELLRTKLKYNLEEEEMN